MNLRQWIRAWSSPEFGVTDRRRRRIIARKQTLSWNGRVMLVATPLLGLIGVGQALEQGGAGDLAIALLMTAAWGAAAIWAIRSGGGRPL